MKPFSNILDVADYFRDKDVCLGYLKQLIWGGDKPAGCPRCGNVTVYHFKDGKTHKCAACRRKFNLFTKTIFENTKLPLKKWILCIWMACSQKRGISSYQVARDIGVTQKTGWFMMHRIRVLFARLRPEALEGTCAADETYIGGKQKNKHREKRVKGQQGRGSSEKINVFGVMQVGGMVISQAVADVKISTLQPIIRQHVTPGSTMMTDEWHGYSGLSSTYPHLVCDHGKYQYVAKNGATTNPLENYWSHVKRAVIGTYYQLTRKHIGRYLAEFDYKFNYRNMSDGDRFGLTLSKLYNTRLSYNQLIQKS